MENDVKLNSQDDRVFSLVDMLHRLRKDEAFADVSTAEWVVAMSLFIVDIQVESDPKIQRAMKALETLMAAETGEVH